MQLRVLLGVAALLTAWVPARGSSIFNFTSVNPQTPLPLTVTNNGVSATFTGSASVCSANLGFQGLSLKPLIQNYCSTNAEGPIGVGFSQNLSSLRFNFGLSNLNPSSVTVSLFENGVADGTYLFPVSVPAGNHTFDEGLISVTGVFNSISFSVPSGAGDMAADNFVADTVAATPEPSTLVLLGSGMFGAAMASQRRSSREGTQKVSGQRNSA